MRQGDHLRALGDGGWDHAIDLGDRTVIRWTPGKGVERCALADFAAGAGPVEVVVHRERVYRPPLVVARAFSRFAESAFAGMFQSAEQFATWCKNGQLPGPAPAAKARPAAPGRRARATRPARKGPGKVAKRAAPRKAAARKVAGKPAGKPARKVAPRRTRGTSRRKAAPRRGARPARKRR